MMALPAEPVEPNTVEFWQAEAVKLQAEAIALRAIIATRDRADAAAASGLVIDNPAHPARNYQLIAEASHQAGVASKTAWSWFDKGQVYGFKVGNSAAIKLCVNDLVDRRLKRGRHGKPCKT
jgi:hypothetical protein